MDANLPSEPGHDASGPRGSVSVTVNDLTALATVQSAQVAFIDPDGTTTLTHTDAAGHATALVAAGASVTVKYSEHDLQSIVDVQPGDELVFGAGRASPAPSVSISFTPLTEPNLDYDLYSSCAGGLPLPAGGGVVDLVHCDGSLTDAELYVLAMRRTADAPTAVASVLMQHVDLTDGKPIVLPNAWTPATPLEVTYTNPIDLDAVVTEVHDRDQFVATQAASKPLWTSKLAVPATGNDSMVRTILQRESGPDVAQILDDHVDASATTFAVDVTARTRTWLASVTYEPSTRTITTTTEAGAALDVDAVQYQVFFGDSAAPYRWSIFAPTIAPLTLPPIPSVMLAKTLTSKPASVDISVFETPALVGWDAARPRLYTLASEAVDVVSGLGTLYIQRYIGFHAVTQTEHLHAHAR